MKKTVFELKSCSEIAPGVFKWTLSGDTGEITRPGQFVNIKIDGMYLRRPISVCDWSEGKLTLIFKVVGKGTEKMAQMRSGASVDILTGLGNGYDTALSGDEPLLIGGGAGVPPLYALAKHLINQGKRPKAILGFNKENEIFLARELEELGVEVVVATADGSVGVKGFVTDAMPNGGYSFFYACGPEPMLRAVSAVSTTSGQLSFEERMGCGFGACMGCTCRTKYGDKRICKDGPVLMKEEVIW